MKTAIYLKEIKQGNLIAWVDLEVVPRGIYQIGDKTYQYVGQPKFIISGPGLRGEGNTLMRVELVVEELSG